MAFFLDQFDFTTGEYYAGDGVYLDLTDDEISNLVDDYSEQEQTPKPRLPRPSPPTYEEIIEKRETSNKDMVLKLKKLGLYEAPKKKNKKRAEPFAKQVFDLFEQDDFYETLDYQQNVFESLRWNGKFKGKLNKEGFFKSEDYHFKVMEAISNCEYQSILRSIRAFVKAEKARGLEHTICLWNPEVCYARYKKAFGNDSGVDYAEELDKYLKLPAFLC